MKSQPKQRMKNWMSLLTASLMLASCASLQRSFEEKYCNKEGGYEKGMNDAHEGSPMNADFSRGCAIEAQDIARGGYREGYQAGLASRASETPSTLINVNVGQDAQHTYYCEIHAFTKTFAAWGATELQAQMGAKEQCTREYHQMHCMDFTCRH